jgi:hypothetical protein
MWGAYGGEGPLWALAPGILRLATLFFAGLVMPIPAPRSIEPAPASRLFEALASPRNTSARCHSAIRVSCFKRISQGEFIGALLKLNSSRHFLCPRKGAGRRVVDEQQQGVCEAPPANVLPYSVPDLVPDLRMGCQSLNLQ